MRNFELLATALLIALFVVPASVAEASVAPPTAAAMPSSELSIGVGVDPGGNVRFVPATILIPQVNITLKVTFYNNYTTPGMDHTFSIFNSDMTAIEISTGNVAPGTNATVEFHINTMTNITYNGTSFVPEATAQGIRWFCIPHRAAGMVGEILLAGLTATTPQKGINLRAYWIGIIGIAATLAWTGISYFVIKSSSRHQKGHREHIRKGLP
jgi:plastocyanin